MIRAVAFDMDGLMFDTEDVYWKAAYTQLERRGHVYTQELNQAIMGRTPKWSFELFIEKFSLPETWTELQEESEKLFLEFLKEGGEPMPKLFQLLDFLETRNIPKCVCTSSSARIAKAVLGKFDLWNRFAFVLTSNDVSHGKPAPDIYLKAAENFCIPPNEMLVLEDSVAGSQAANAAGAVPVVVLAHHNRDGNFEAAKWIVDSLVDAKVLELINSQQRFDYKLRQFITSEGNNEP